MIDQFARETIACLAEECETSLRMELASLDAQDFEAAAVYAESAQRASEAAFRVASAP